MKIVELIHKLISIFLLVGLSHSGSAQCCNLSCCSGNLIRDGGFESSENINHSWNKSDWNVLYNPSKGRSSVVRGEGGSNSPSSYAERAYCSTNGNESWVELHSNYGGFYSERENEAITQELSTKMIKGRLYKLSFWAASNAGLSHGGKLRNSSTISIKVWHSTFNKWSLNIGGTPIFDNFKLTGGKKEWKKYEKIFLADRDYKFIVIQVRKGYNPSIDDLCLTAVNQPSRWYIGDFNGDGKDDLLRQINEHGGAEVLISTGSSFENPIKWSGAGNRKNGWYVGDFNGDGKDDIFRQLNEHGGAEMTLSTGSKFSEVVRWSGAGNRKNGWYVGDFNGDGKDDIFRQLNEHGGAEMTLSTGSKFSEVVRWSGAGNRENGWYVGDFNGDGKDDIFRQLNEHGGSEMTLSTGSKFSEVVRWTSAGNRKNGWYVGDFNGDGKDDILRQINQYGGAEVLLSTGSVFSSPSIWTEMTNTY